MTDEELKAMAEKIRLKYFDSLRLVPVEVGVIPKSETDNANAKYDPSMGENGAIVASRDFLNSNPSDVAISNTLKHEHVHAELFFEGDKQHRWHVGRWQIRMREVEATPGHIRAAYLVSLLEINRDKIIQGEISQEAWSKMKEMCEIAVALKKEEENQSEKPEGVATPTGKEQQVK